MLISVLLLLSQMGRSELGAVDFLDAEYERASIVGQKVGVVVLPSGFTDYIKVFDKTFPTKESFCEHLQKDMVKHLEKYGVTGIPLKLNKAEKMMFRTGYSHKGEPKQALTTFLEAKALEMGVQRFMVINRWDFVKYGEKNKGFDIGLNGTYAYRLYVRGGVLDQHGYPLYTGEAEALAPRDIFSPTKSLKLVTEKAAKHYALIFTGEMPDNRLKWNARPPWVDGDAPLKTRQRSRAPDCRCNPRTCKH